MNTASSVSGILSVTYIFNCDENVSIEPPPRAVSSSK